MSIKDAKALGIDLGLQDHKFNARQTEIDGIKFPSEKEGTKYSELKLQKRAGLIKDFTLQPEFTLQEGFTHKGKYHRPITYKADFLVINNDGTEIIIDTKGFKTKDYKNKKKMLLKKFPEINFVEE